MMHQQSATPHYSSAQAGGQHYQGQPAMGMMSQGAQGNSMMSQRPMGTYRSSQQGRWSKSSSRLTWKSWMWPGNQTCCVWVLKLKIWTVEAIGLSLRSLCKETDAGGDAAFWQLLQFLEVFQSDDWCCVRTGLIIAPPCPIMCLQRV